MTGDSAAMAPGTPGLPDAPEFRGHFAHARAGRVAFPCCRACGRFHWYPMPRCPSCLSPDIEWRPVAGRAELYAFTVVRHAFDKGRALPYVVGLVTFADAPGVRLVTNIVGADPAALAIGRALEPVFAGPDDPTAPAVQFRPTARA